MNFIFVSAFAAGLKESSAYDLSQTQCRLFLQNCSFAPFFSLQNCLIFYQPLKLGTRGGAVVRALARHPCGLGSTPYVGWVCCCFSPLLPAKGFSPGTLVSLPFSLKNLARTTWKSSGTVKPGLGETTRISNLMNKTLLQGLCLYYQ